MLYLILKAAISGVLIAAASETARRAPALGALILSLPLVSVLSFIWLWRDTGDTARIAAGQGVEVVGHRDGYWTESEEARVVAAVRETRPDILFLAVPSPGKEYFLARRQKDLGCALVVGVGGSFDVVAGLRSRAPRWIQRAGLEWFHRLVQEPRRMFLRYAVGNTRFVALTASYWARLSTGRGADA